MYFFGSLLDAVLARSEMRDPNLWEITYRHINDDYVLRMKEVNE